MSSSSFSTTSSSSSSSSSSSEPAGRLRFDPVDLDRYDDAPWDIKTNIAVSALTREGVLRGNDDGTFQPRRNLNRAEFVQIIMRLMNDTGTVNLNCFPDVSPNVWYADPVCRAKALGLVRGNARVGVSEDLWRFEPTRDVQYEEAVKILVKVYALPTVGDEEGADWYVPFIRAAEEMGLNIDGLVPGERITRGEMARLTLAFVAESTGQLGEYRDAEGEPMSSSSRSSSRSSTSSSRSSSSSSRSSMGSGQFDPLSDKTIESSVMLLGSTSPVLAGVKFFSNNEPVLVDRITVELNADADSVQSLLIYTANGELLGTATETSVAGTYQANIVSGRFELPRREDRSIYIRARLKDDEGGGVGGETVQVDNVQLRGTGVWSTDEYNTTSTGTFPEMITSEAVIRTVTNVGPTTGALTGGSGQLIGQFRFTSENAGDTSEARITSLRFQIEQVGNVTLSNVRLRGEGGTESSCTVSSSTITCNSIPTAIGDVDPAQTMKVYADVNVPSNATDPTLRISLNEPGTISSQGSITWTDGTNTYNWVPLDQPVVQGTRFE